VHFAAIPRVLIEPDNETFRVNTVSTYNVIEAAAKLGVRKIVIASSETPTASVLPKATGFQKLPARGGLRHRSHGFLRAFQGRE